MPTVADYAVLRDEPIEISAGSIFETNPFFAPEGFVAGTNLARAILAYKAEPIPLAPFGAIAEFEIQRGIADSIELIRLRSATPHGLWESFPATGFSANIGTSFRFIMRIGRVRFSDIVLWYQVQV
jgi:hypothetical protein